MLQEALNRAEQSGVAHITKTIRADLEHAQGSSLEDNMSDWTLVANILYQADPAKILTEAKRITKKNGIIIVTEWDTASTPVGPPPESRVPLNQVKDIAARLKLIILKQFNPSPYHFGLLLKKTS
jgi:ubiquinone/menaquinone biosynthesis C-methylase UbiE